MQVSIYIYLWMYRSMGLLMYASTDKFMDFFNSFTTCITAPNDAPKYISSSLKLKKLMKETMSKASF